MQKIMDYQYINEIILIFAFSFDLLTFSKTKRVEFFELNTLRKSQKDGKSKNYWSQNFFSAFQINITYEMI
jgi:hypothetical protein